MTEATLQVHPQMFRAVYTDSTSAVSTAPLNTVSIQPTLDGTTGQYSVHWEDILKVYGNAVYILNGSTAVPFLMDKNSERLDPLQIQTFPDVVLDVVVRTLGGDVDLQSKTIEDTSGLSSIISSVILDSSKSSPATESSGSSTSTNITEEYLNATNQGDADAQFKLGFMYDKGNGVPQDYPKAIEWYLKSANQGHANAQFNLGFMYSNGNGVPQDYPKAIEWYLKSANQGHAKAQLNLGFLYENGKGVPQDYSKAIEWYLKSANQGHANAQFNLGFMYSNGNGVLQDYPKAIEWYLKSANQGHAKAQLNLGFL
ncbi:hypothetical protein BGZ58_004459, partial [Dissophora ornata]